MLKVSPAEKAQAEITDADQILKVPGLEEDGIADSLTNQNRMTDKGNHSPAFHVRQTFSQW